MSDFDVDDAVARATGSGHREGPTDDVDDVDDVDQGGGAPDPSDAPTAPTGDGGGAPSSTQGLVEWLKDPASKSHREVDAGDFFDLEGGGRNRLALVASDYLGSRYPPRLYQLAVGIIEEAIGFSDGLDVEEGDPTDGGREEDVDDDDPAVPLTEVEAV